MARRPRGIPFFRMGMLLVVGALAASLFEFYVGFGALASDLDAREQLPENREELGRYFFRTFFLTGSIPMLLFWAGIILCILGIMRNLRRAAAARDDPAGL